MTTKASEFIWKKVFEEAKAILVRCQYTPEPGSTEPWECKRYARFLGNNIVGNQLAWCEHHKKHYEKTIGLTMVEEHPLVRLLDAIQAYESLGA